VSDGVPVVEIDGATFNDLAGFYGADGDEAEDGYQARVGVVATSQSVPVGGCLH
jgi:hypothetical protein